MGFNTFIDGLGDKIVGKDEYDYDEYYDEDEYYEDDEPKRSLFGSKKRNDLQPIGEDTANASSTVMLIEPQTFNDAPLVCDKLKYGITVVVNMDKVENENAKKIFDFLSGAVYVLNASMKRIAENVFILAPQGVEVETQEKRSAYETATSDIWD